MTTSKIRAPKVLDGVFVAVAAVLLFVATGLPADWLMNLVGTSFREFQAFALFLLQGTLLLIHAIATSDSAA